MSDYTISLKRIIDMYGEGAVESWFRSYSLFDYLPEDQTIFINKYSVFDPFYLAKMIVEHYYLREIAFETPEMFKHYALIKMKEIMGKYAPLIYSASLSYNPLEFNNINLTETFTKSKNEKRSGSENNTQTNGTEATTTNNNSSFGSSYTSGDSNSTSTNNASSLNVASDTPQGMISKQQILQGNYASSTSANESESSINDTTNSSSSNTLSNTERKTQNENISQNIAENRSSQANSNENETYKKIKSGYDHKNLTASVLISEYRKNIVNIYESIIEDLNPLFFALY